MDINTIKALHIIFVVSWFAGLFYIVRLFIYHTEAQERDEVAKEILSNQYQICLREILFLPLLAQDYWIQNEGTKIFFGL